MAIEIFNRRAVHFFDPARPLGDETLTKIINLASTAPSAFNLQPWAIIAVKSDKARKMLYELAMKQDKILEAPVTLLILGDRGGYSDANPVWEELAKVLDEGTDGYKQIAAQLYGSSEERKIKFAESNAGLLAMSIMYAAKYYEVDSHPMSGIDFEGIKKAFDVPRQQEVVMAIALGYSDTGKELWPKGYRKPFEDLVKLV